MKVVFVVTATLPGYKSEVLEIFETFKDAEEYFNKIDIDNIHCPYRSAILDVIIDNQNVIEEHKILYDYDYEEVRYMNIYTKFNEAYYESINKEEEYDPEFDALLDELEKM